MYVCGKGRVSASSEPAHIIYQQQCVCIRLSSPVSERIPLCVGCTISSREGDEGVAEHRDCGGTVQEENPCSVSKMWTRYSLQHS